jgi:NAD(P)H-hydrate epimerase
MLRLTRDQSRRVDHIAIVEYQMPGIVLMENASRGAADVAMRMLSSTSTATVGIVCGSGNNGGDGLAMARHLHNRGVLVTIFHPTDASKLSPDAAVNCRIVERMPIRKVPATAESIRGFRCDLLIDAVLGTGPSEPLRPETARLVDAMNANPAPKLAVDVPTGLDCDTGLPLGVAVRATRTATFVAEKVGFAFDHARRYTGQVEVIDIGCPVEVITQAIRDAVAV